MIAVGDGKSATVEKPQTAPSEAELGAPIYPGATFDAENSSTVKYRDQQGHDYTSTARFLTNDGFDEVVSFYRGKIGEPRPITSTSAWWQWGEITAGNLIMIKVEQGDGNVKISITGKSASEN